MRETGKDLLACPDGDAGVAKFTPGPWRLRRGIRNIFVESLSPTFTRSIARITSRSTDEPNSMRAAEANAHIIAAAPDMFGAGNNALDIFESILGRCEADNWNLRLGGHAQDFEAGVAAFKALKAALASASPATRNEG